MIMTIRMTATGDDDVTRTVMTTTKTTIIMRPWTILKNNIARRIMLGNEIQHGNDLGLFVLIWVKASRSCD